MPERRFLKARRSSYKRPTNRRELRLRILIVCEGEKTEPNYFKKFPLTPDSVVDVRGVGANTISLVKEAMQLRDNANHRYDEVWCVFDRDSFPPENFNAALQMARANKIQVAYSNEAFELWYLLHFCYLNSGMCRRDYGQRLERYLGHAYLKNSTTIYEELLTRQKDAIRNAARLLTQYTPSKPAIDNPSTTVHLLVEKLNRLFWD